MIYKAAHTFTVPVLEHVFDNETVDGLKDYYLQHIPQLDSGIEQNTDYHKERNYELLPVLQENIIGMTKQYLSILFMNNLSKDYDITYWLQDYSLSRYHSIHKHPEAILSGVYFLRAEGECAPLVFMDIDQTRDYITGGAHIKEVETIEGKMLLFPSWLNHHVPSIIHDGKRTVLAFNIIEKK